jgi:hypothetical protein
MGEDNQKRWVVLINRAPKGPLTEEEIHTLLTQGVIRRNDIAYRVGEEGPKSASEWKILWQFPEFDRRFQEGNEKSEKKEPTTLGTPERRQSPDPAEIAQKKLTEVPLDLYEITPEELIPKSTGLSVNLSLEKPIDFIDTPIPPQPRARFGWFRQRWVTLGVPLSSFLLVAYWILSDSELGEVARAPLNIPSSKMFDPAGVLTESTKSGKREKTSLPLRKEPIVIPESEPPPPSSRNRPEKEPGFEEDENLAENGDISPVDDEEGEDENAEPVKKKKTAKAKSKKSKKREVADAESDDPADDSADESPDKGEDEG